MMKTPVDNLTVSYLQRSDSAKEIAGRKGFCRANPPLTSIAFEERLMAMIPPSACIASAQDFTDPLILQTRIVNDAAALERALAARKALRPARSAAARKGWESRHG